MPTLEVVNLPVTGIRNIYNRYKNSIPYEGGDLIGGYSDDVPGGDGRVIYRGSYIDAIEASELPR